MNKYLWSVIVSIVIVFIPCVSYADTELTLKSDKVFVPPDTMEHLLACVKVKKAYTEKQKFMQCVFDSIRNGDLIYNVLKGERVNVISSSPGDSVSRALVLTGQYKNYELFGFDIYK
jgi:hypothetical protein